VRWILLLAGCPAIYSPDLPDLAAAVPDLAVSPFLSLVADDPCDGACGDGETCVAACEPPAGACDFNACPAGFLCLDGACEKGCLVDRCAGVTCAANQRCGRDGRCHPSHACDRSCPGGAACTVWCIAQDDCEGVRCDPGQSCLHGICVEDPCAGLRCPPPTICIGGACVDSCNPPASGTPGGCDGACSIGRACIDGSCRIKRCDPGCSCLEDCVDGECALTCRPPNFPCACDCCSPSQTCGPDGRCH
jgi:hypothetical protein